MRTPALLLTATLALSLAAPARNAGAGSKPPSEADARIRRYMRERFKKPERRTWRIAYHPIRGLSDQSAWHVDGTPWRARLYPSYRSLDSLEKTEAYEIDAVALAQNYGVIDFYVYGFPKKVGR